MTSLDYKNAGVDIEAGDELVNRIKPKVALTTRPEVLAGLGGFGSLFALSSVYKEPVLVSGTDGVGTKLKLAFQLNRHDTIGIDLVAMSVNDVLVQGAEPLFFLDYFACGKLDTNEAEIVINGIAEGCLQAGCTLIGGETAEMPGMYSPGEYDLAGFAVGVVERSNIINGSTISPGDCLLGLPSSGFHSNGYSLIRKVIEQSQLNLNDTIYDTTIADLLMTPTRIYVKPILNLLQALPGIVKGMAHITGGGLVENLPRMYNNALMAVVHSFMWQRHPIFDTIQTLGNISRLEMYRVFNCGIGMVLVVDPQNAHKVASELQALGETVLYIGHIEERTEGQPGVIML